MSHLPERDWEKNVNGKRSISLINNGQVTTAFLCGKPLKLKALIRLLTLCGAWLALSSCDQLTTDLGVETAGGVEMSSLTPTIDSYTNWLLSCSENEDCAEGEQCSCGSCVIPCEETSGCAIRAGDPRAPQVECSREGPVSELDSCGEEYTNVQICLPRCQLNDDCPFDLFCDEGACRLPRRGKRGCEEARRCVEGGGEPEACIESCPVSGPEIIMECERLCVEMGRTPEDCRRMCMARLSR